MLVRAEFGHVGLLGPTIPHPIVPWGYGVVLLGGITVAVKVTEHPKTIVGLQLAGSPGEGVAATSTVVVAACSTTKLKVPDAPLGPWANAVSCWAPLLGHVPVVAATQLEPWASHCCTGFTAMEYPTGAVPSVVPPTTNGVGEAVLVPSLTDTFWVPVTEPGTTKVTVAFPLASVVEPLVMDAGTAPPPPAGVRVTWRPVLAENPVTKTTTDAPTGPTAGMGALTSR